MRRIGWVGIFGFCIVTLALAGCGKKEVEAKKYEEKAPGQAMMESLDVNSMRLGATPPFAEVKMKSVAGDWVSILDVKGEKGTLVVFTCVHCPYVKAWQTRMILAAKGISSPARPSG